MNYKIGQHNYKDYELCTGKELAEALGVSTAAVSHAKNGKNGAPARLDTYEDSNGNPKFVKALAIAQFSKNKNPSKVTTATKGQKAMGLSDFGARVIAQQKHGLTAESVSAGSAQRPMSDEEAYDFAESRAKREHFAADMAAIKVATEAGLLVDKNKASNKISEIANGIKDRLLSLHLRVAQSVIGSIEKALVENGIESNDARIIIANSKLDSVIGETVRKEIIVSLRDIVESEKIKID